MLKSCEQSDLKLLNQEGVQPGSQQLVTPIKVISLFSGCGGMDLGFKGGFTFLGKKYESLPFRILWSNEINPAACRTYRSNVSNHLIEGDIWCAMSDLPREADVIIGGFPCQDISINGRGEGINGQRSGLYKAMVEAVSRVKPRLFVAENVKGLLMRHNQEGLHKVMSDFESLGYRVAYKLYQAADYGVPQTRERVLITGALPETRPIREPQPTHTKAQYVTASQAIGDLVEMDEDSDFNHVWSKANRSPDQGDRRLKPDRPGYTIRAECHGNIQWHYDLPRRISMREAARIQSFPDDFRFFAGLRESERQIGNAVPPVLAWHVANSVADSLA